MTRKTAAQGLLGTETPPREWYETGFEDKYCMNKWLHDFLRNPAPMNGAVICPADDLVSIFKHYRGRYKEAYANDKMQYLQWPNCKKVRFVTKSWARSLPPFMIIKDFT